jgi:hypothetical protein
MAVFGTVTPDKEDEGLREAVFAVTISSCMAARL